ncbi:transposase [Cylindrospermum sp. FACHB-282]|uniref:transposase n=1 Tax=Cylindrospermum sp. FACHB-282 TaxID=2692794 RepID=UPI001687F63C|nr:transposase [Cylindrospermum sp. FACHB-282]
MDWQAQTAAHRLLETGQITVIIHDNASVHKSYLARQQHQRWQQQGLYVFFLPPYSPQMNRIEDVHQRFGLFHRAQIRQHQLRDDLRSHSKI